MRLLSCVPDVQCFFFKGSKHNFVDKISIWYKIKNVFSPSSIINLAKPGGGNLNFQKVDFDLDLSSYSQQAEWKMDKVLTALCSRFCIPYLSQLVEKHYQWSFFLEETEQIPIFNIDTLKSWFWSWACKLTIASWMKKIHSSDFTFFCVLSYHIFHN